MKSLRGQRLDSIEEMTKEHGFVGPLALDQKSSKGCQRREKSLSHDRESRRHRESNWHSSTFSPNRGILGNQVRKIDWTQILEGIEYQTENFQLIIW